MWVCRLKKLTTIVNLSGIPIRECVFISLELSGIWISNWFVPILTWGISSPVKDRGSGSTWGSMFNLNPLLVLFTLFIILLKVNVTLIHYIMLYVLNFNVFSWTYYYYTYCYDLFLKVISWANQVQKIKFQVKGKLIWIIQLPSEETHFISELHYRFSFQKLTIGILYSSTTYYKHQVT